MLQAGRDLKVHLVPTLLPMGMEFVEPISQMEIGLFSCDQSFSSNCCQRLCDVENLLISLNLFSIIKNQTGWEIYPGKVSGISGSMIQHFIKSSYLHLFFSFVNNTDVLLAMANYLFFCWLSAGAKEFAWMLLFLACLETFLVLSRAKCFKEMHSQRRLKICAHNVW